MKRIKLSEESTLNVSISSLEALRCFKCNGYLSSSPVRSLPNGNCICGRCSPNAETPVTRIMAFESLLCKLSFPCIFKEYGCVEMLTYGKTANHEAVCLYKPFACPFSIFANCLWKGARSQLSGHLNEKHPDILKNNVNFNLEVDKDVQGILMTTEKSFPFILKYFYTAAERILKYDLRFCVNKNVFAGFYNIQLINGVDLDCNVNLKMSKCCLYNDSFLEMQNSKVLNLNKFLECLGEPNCIVVAVKLKVVKSNNGNVLPENNELNSSLIKSLRCYQCRNYLIPPLFHFDDNAICCDCAKRYSSCKPLDDTNLVERVNEAIYPCQWRGCNALCKSNNFKDHRVNCQFRLYNCFSDFCNVNFKLSAAIDHLKSHNIVCCETGGITYKTSFAKCYAGTDVITKKNNTIIRVSHSINYHRPDSAHNVKLFKLPGDYAMGTVFLEHKHCKIKSKEFIVSTSKDLEITLDQLPSCFEQKDELSVTVDIITE